MNLKRKTHKIALGSILIIFFCSLAFASIYAFNAKESNISPSEHNLVKDFFNDVPKIIDKNTYPISEIMETESTGSFQLLLSSNTGGSMNPQTGLHNYEAGSIVTVNAIADTGYFFKNWTENGVVISESPSYSFTILDDREMKANFEEQVFQLTILNSVGGSTEPLVGIYEYTYGEAVNIKANVSENYAFVEWIGDIANIGDVDAVETSVQMLGDYTIQANFVQNKYTLTMSKTGEGMVKPDIGTYVYNAGDEVEVEGIGAMGYRWYNWKINGEDNFRKGAKFVLTIDQDYIIEAIFDIGATTLDAVELHVSSTSGGSVTQPGEGSFYPAQFNVVDLVASSEANYTFTHWSGDIVDINNPYSANTTILMNGNATVQAHFALEVSGTASSLNTGELIFFNSQNSNVIVDQNTAEVSRYAWSDEVGWIDFSSVGINKGSGAFAGNAVVLNTGHSIFLDGITGSEVIVSLADGTVSGHAWSDDIGWIEFDNVIIGGISTKSLTYGADVGGIIVGVAYQEVPFWGSGTEVSASEGAGYYFLNWNDGVLTGARTDSDVIENLNLIAIFEILGGIEFVDGDGNVVSNVLKFDDVDFSFEPQEVLLKLGQDNQRVRISKGDYIGEFTIVLSALDPSWMKNLTEEVYSYSSEFASSGLLLVDPSVGTIDGVNSCSNTGLSKGSATSFYDDGNITLMHGDEFSASNCQWDLRGMDLKQTIPGGVHPGNYTLELVLTMI